VREIVETRPLEVAIGHVEARWTDHVDADAQARRHAQNGAGVLGDVGLIKGEAHVSACYFLNQKNAAAPNCPCLLKAGSLVALDKGCQKVARPIVHSRLWGLLAAVVLRYPPAKSRHRWCCSFLFRFVQPVVVDIG
jgi:hypothetical protein